MTDKEYHFIEGQQEAYENMNKVISGAIKRNGGATTALQIINVFNELTSSLHYNLSITKDKLEGWVECDTDCPCEEPDVFAEEMNALTDILEKMGWTAIKGGK